MTLEPFFGIEPKTEVKLIGMQSKKVVDSCEKMVYSDCRKGETIMREALENYIKACENNIAQYMLIEDQEERQLALDAAYGMKADFEKMLEEL